MTSVDPSALLGDAPAIAVLRAQHAREYPAVAGAIAVSLSGPLLGDAFAGGDVAALTDRAHRLTKLVREALRQRKAR